MDVEANHSRALAPPSTSDSYKTNAAPKPILTLSSTTRVTTMQTFMIQLQFTQPFDTFADIVPAHRAFLQTGYDQRMLLMSGPKQDKTGGIIIARAESESRLREFMAQDPYLTHGLATHEFIPFAAAKRAPQIEAWVTGAD